MTFILAACFPAAPPPPITADIGTEFTLAPGQTATLTGSGLTIILVAVTGDDRCPINVECAATGPVTFTISVQTDSAAPTEFVMRAFTDVKALQWHQGITRMEDSVREEYAWIVPEALREFMVYERMLND